MAGQQMTALRKTLRNQSRLLQIKFCKLRIPNRGANVILKDNKGLPKHKAISNSLTEVLLRCTTVVIRLIRGCQGDRGGTGASAGLPLGSHALTGTPRVA